MPSMIENIVNTATILKRMKHVGRKEKEHKAFCLKHAATPKSGEGEATPKRFFPLEEGERTKRRREAQASRRESQGFAACRQDPDHFIEFQLRTGSPPMDGEPQKPCLQRDKTLRLSHLDASVAPVALSRQASDDEEKNVPRFPAVFGTEITRLDREYMDRKADLGERYITLPDDRRLYYFEDGEPHGVPVLAFHDGCEGKSRFMQKDPIPGVRLVSIDRPGYGGSAHAHANYTFEHAVQDVKHLTERLHIQEFVVLGHGIGGAWAQQLAAALPNRVRGAILWSSVADVMDSKATGDLRRALGYSDSIHYCNTGHVGRSPRHFMRGTSTAVAKDDFGALGLNLEREEGRTVFEKFAGDPFWVSAMVDTWRPNRNRKSIREDVSKVLCSKWKYCAKDIKCPVFIFHGDGDRDARCPAVPNFLKTVIPHAQVEIIEDCGHICSFGPDEATRERIQKAVKSMPPLLSSRSYWLLQPH
eukprot:gnl/MRDRNA2_/MRDRNA2_91106_c0_seq1.p1 gnl/MRDRNA2_/MRDRNA2_91106_c0~~gnl/MRDRNA2_/MRDRNA2_91106_c0_seq1.p1  ORF type:complete len:474 (+),score=86.84 gnl/MRDRNA2_/MRDRNA2_91106_c0_seq1:79-1500(+)